MQKRTRRFIGDEPIVIVSVFLIFRKDMLETSVGAIVGPQQHVKWSDTLSLGYIGVMLCQRVSPVPGTRRW